MKFRKKPVVIDAMQFTGSTAEAMTVYQWVEKHIGSIDPYGPPEKLGVSIDPADGKMFIRTLEGDMKVSDRDWVIRGVQGEFYPCKPDIFAMTYEPAEGETE